MLAEIKRRHPTWSDFTTQRAYIRILAGDLRPETFRDLRSTRDGRPRVERLKAFRDIPLWDGQPIPGKRLLIWRWSGFGYGDLIQNFRLVPTAKAQSGATITLGCPKGFSRLFHAKRGADRYVPILPALADELRTHLRGRHTGFLFESNRHTRYSTRTVQAIVTACARTAGIQKRVYPHLLRHSIATILLDSGLVPIDQVQKFLGHLRLSTTQMDAETSLRALGDNYIWALGGKR
jgi:integrase